MIEMVNYYDRAQWFQKGCDIDGDTVNSRIAYSLSMSSNGMIVAIGEPYSVVSYGFSTLSFFNNPNG